MNKADWLIAIAYGINRGGVTLTGEECEELYRCFTVPEDERFKAECWQHAVNTNMIRDGKDGVALIESEVLTTAKILAANSSTHKG